MKNKLIYLTFFFFIYHNAKASDPFPVVEAIQTVANGITAKAPSQKDYKQFQQIRYTSDVNIVKDCTFIKKISLSNEDFVDLPKKNCDEMIHKMSFDKTYTTKNILFFEYIPLECTPQNLNGKLFKCN